MYIIRHFTKPQNVRRNKNTTMAKTTIEKIIEGKILDFKTNFISTSRNIFSDEDSLIHSGEFGVNRENIVKEFLTHFVTPEYNIGTGFITSSKGNNSHQCDIIISHKAHTPLIKDTNNTQFFTAESVVGIGEIKSVLTKSKLKEALVKLSSAKELRHLSTDENSSIVKKRLPNKITHYDLPISFLICEKLDFNLSNLVSELNDLYGDTKAIYKHNFLLSLSDGLFTYYTNTANGGSSTIQYPVLNDVELKNLLIEGEVNNAIKIFASFLGFSIQNVTVFEPYLIEYLKDFTDEVLKFE